jgi:pyrroloquinoline-quinone synthase
MRLSETLQEVIRKSRLLDHPFYVAWSKGQLTREQLARYAVQYAAQVRAFPRWVSAVHSRTPDVGARKVLLRNLVDEELAGVDHPELWCRFADALGVDRSTMEQVPLRPETQQTVDAYFDLASGPWTQGLCALFAYESQVPEVSVSKMEGLRQFYGIADERATAFFRVHMDADVAHSQAVAALIDAHASADEAIPATERAAKASWTFLDGMARDCGMTPAA